MKDRGQRDLRQRIGPQHRGGFQPPTMHTEQWTVDSFWKKDRPTGKIRQTRIVVSINRSKSSYVGPHGIRRDRL